MKRTSTIMVCLLFAAALAATGCNDYVKVRGKVTYEDGEPLPKGVVLLQNEKYQAKGMIRPDGSFTIGSLKADDGVPPGVYGVSFVSTHIEISTGSGLPADTDLLLKPTQTVHEIVLEQLLNEKYSNANTSGIVYDTKDGPVLNITVERP